MQIDSLPPATRATQNAVQEPSACARVLSQRENVSHASLTSLIGCKQARAPPDPFVSHRLILSSHVGAPS